MSVLRRHYVGFSTCVCMFVLTSASFERFSPICLNETRIQTLYIFLKFSTVGITSVHNALNCDMGTTLV